MLIDFRTFCNFEHLMPRMNKHLLFHKWVVSVQNEITVVRGKLQIRRVTNRDAFMCLIGWLSFSHTVP